MAGPTSGDPAEMVPGGTGTGATTINGDTIFALADRQDRIARRLDDKIKQLDRRITALEERGRS